MAAVLTRRALRMRGLALTSLAQRAGLAVPTAAELQSYPRDAYVGECWRSLVTVRRRRPRDPGGTAPARTPRHWALRLVLAPMGAAAFLWNSIVAFAGGIRKWLGR